MRNRKTTRQLQQLANRFNGKRVNYKVFIFLNWVLIVCLSAGSTGFHPLPVCRPVAHPPPGPWAIKFISFTMHVCCGWLTMYVGSDAAALISAEAIYQSHHTTPQPRNLSTYFKSATMHVSCNGKRHEPPRSLRRWSCWSPVSQSDCVSISVRQTNK